MTPKSCIRPSRAVYWRVTLLATGMRWAGKRSTDKVDKEEGSETIKRGHRVGHLSSRPHVSERRQGASHRGSRDQVWGPLTLLALPTGDFLTSSALAHRASIGPHVTVRTGRGSRLLKPSWAGWQQKKAVISSGPRLLLAVTKSMARYGSVVSESDKSHRLVCSVIRVRSERSASA